MPKNAFLGFFFEHLDRKSARFLARPDSWRQKINKCILAPRVRRPKIDISKKYEGGPLGPQGVEYLMGVVRLPRKSAGGYDH